MGLVLGAVERKQKGLTVPATSEGPKQRCRNRTMFLRHCVIHRAGNWSDAVLKPSNGKPALSLGCFGTDGRHGGVSHGVKPLGAEQLGMTSTTDLRAYIIRTRYIGSAGPPAVFKQMLLRGHSLPVSGRITACPVRRGDRNYPQNESEPKTSAETSHSIDVRDVHEAGS